MRWGEWDVDFESWDGFRIWDVLVYMASVLFFGLAWETQLTHL